MKHSGSSSKSSLVKLWLERWKIAVKAIVNQTYYSLIKPNPLVEDLLRLCNYKLKRRKHHLRNKTSAYASITSVPTRTSSSSQFLVDVSNLIRVDRHTGIERVLRSVLMSLGNAIPEGMELFPVFANDSGEICYVAWPSLTTDEFGSRPEGPVQVRAGDIFFSADFYMDFPFMEIQRLSNLGLHSIFTVYDIIPLLYPQFHWKCDVLSFKNWLEGLLNTADGVICDSRSAANDLFKWLEEHPWIRKTPLPVGYFYPGAEMDASRKSSGMNIESQLALQACEKRPTFLMVGTLEPRKGHACVVEAMDLLWNSGIDANLVIVGREGWRTHQLVKNLQTHSQVNKRLFWLTQASDDTLEELYFSSSALIAASYAEGFGLPLIEAAEHNLPIIARDIPVFREVAGDNAFYFEATTVEELAASLKCWMQLRESGALLQSSGLNRQTWKESVDQILRVILDDEWYKFWSPPNQNLH